MAQTLFDGSIIYALYLTIYLDVYYETMEEAEVGKIGPKSSLKQNPFPIYFFKHRLSSFLTKYFLVLPDEFGGDRGGERNNE